jgi:hypothetical protein
LKKDIYLFSNQQSRKICFCFCSRFFVFPSVCFSIQIMLWNGLNNVRYPDRRN